MRGAVARSATCRTSAGIALAILAAAPATAQQLVYTGSIQFATGDYIFAQRTSSAYLFNGFSAYLGPMRVSANIPVIYQSTPWVSFAGGGMIPSGGTEHSETARQVGHGMNGRSGGGGVALVDTSTYNSVGVGDPLASATIEVLRQGRVGPSVRLTGYVKVPLADVERGFGTGEWDYAGGLSFAKNVGRTLVLVDLVYWFLGDLPDLELKDPVSYAVSLGRPLGDGRVSLLASLAGYTEIVPGVDPALQLGFGLSYLVGFERSLSASAGFGLTESTPDISLSVGWQFGL